MVDIDVIVYELIGLGGEVMFELIVRFGFIVVNVDGVLDCVVMW